MELKIGTKVRNEIPVSYQFILINIVRSYIINMQLAMALACAGYIYISLIVVNLQGPINILLDITSLSIAVFMVSLLTLIV